MLAIDRGMRTMWKARIDKSSKWRELDLTKPGRKLHDLIFRYR
jgi:hypothetical protein